MRVCAFMLSLCFFSHFHNICFSLKLKFASFHLVTMKQLVVKMAARAEEERQFRASIHLRLQLSSSQVGVWMYGCELRSFFSA